MYVVYQLFILDYADLLDIQIQLPDSQYFLVPTIYQRNPHFIGIDDLIEKLRQNLCASQLETYNHRVALYGMGGVGNVRIISNFR